ncbi:MAG: zinc transporter [Paraglaciecola sp.]|jgi:zinc transporter
MHDKKLKGSQEANSSVLWAFHIDPSRVARSIPVAEVKSAQHRGGFTWVHLQSDADGANDVMQNLGLPSKVINLLGALDTRPKTLQIDEGLLIYLRGVNKNPNADPEDMVSLRIWLTDRGLVSARRRNRKLLSIQDVLDSINEGQTPENSSRLLIAIIASIADRINEMVDALDEELVEFESAENILSYDRKRLSVIRRKAASLRRYLAPQRDALDSLYRLNKIINSDEAFEIRELADRMTRYVEELDLARERSIVLQDEHRNRIAEQQGMRMYVLSMVTAIFLPLSFLTGIFGMNVAGLPGVEYPHAFNYLAGGMLILALVLLVLMRWQKWF